MPGLQRNPGDRSNDPRPREGLATVRPANVDPQRVLTPYQVVSVEGDYLVCNPFNGDGSVNTGRKRYVLKPWTLQKTPFDGKTINSITYTYTSNTQRTAVNGSTSETQLITQDYFAGAKIYAVLIEGKVNLPAGAGAGKFTNKIDANLDARAWAVQ
jgi:hypothetical protein